MRENFGVSRWSRIAAAVAVVAIASGLTLAAAADAAPAPPSSTSATTKPPAKKVTKLDINTATKQELEKVPGIGEAYSQKIIAGRPYKSKADLKTRKILPESVYEKVSPYIIAREPDQQ